MAGMDKYSAAEELKKKGYECSVDSGVVMIRGHKDAQFLSSLKKELKDIGYDGSFGIHASSAQTKQNEQKVQISVSDVDDSVVTDSDMAGSMMTSDGMDDDMYSSDLGNDNESGDADDADNGGKPEIDYSSDGQGTFNF